MKKIALMFLMLAIGVAVGIRISGRLSPVEGQAKPGTGFAAVPGAVGGQDLSGAYDVVKNWPKDVSTLPGNEKWTYGAGESVFRPKVLTASTRSIVVKYQRWRHRRPCYCRKLAPASLSR